MISILNEFDLTQAAQYVQDKAQPIIQGAKKLITTGAKKVQDWVGQPATVAPPVPNVAALAPTPGFTGGQQSVIQQTGDALKTTGHRVWNVVTGKGNPELAAQHDAAAAAVPTPVVGGVAPTPPVNTAALAPAPHVAVPTPVVGGVAPTPPVNTAALGPAPHVAVPTPVVGGVAPAPPVNTAALGPHAAETQRLNTMSSEDLRKGAEAKRALDAAAAQRAKEAVDPNLKAGALTPDLIKAREEQAAQRLKKAARG